MAVNTYLLDFTIDANALETTESRKQIQETVENALKEYVPELKKESVIDLDGGFLQVLTGSHGIFVTVRGFRQGIVTINIEYYKPDSEEGLLTFERIRSLESLLQTRLDSKKSHKYPAFKRACGMNRYLLSADERILEYDIDKVVFEEKSPYQKVQIVHSKSLGNLLILDELQNMSESDLIYTETLMQRGLENYEDKEIIILGGGDGCLLWELLKEKPKFITMLELDEVVIKACGQFLRSSCGNCLDTYKGDRYEIIVGDCFDTLQKFIDEGKKVDYVFGDLTDVPVDSSGEHTEAWEFIRYILNKSMQVLRPGGKFLTHGNGASVPKSLQHYEKVLKSLKVPVDFTKTHAFVPSFLEDWVFYQVTPRLTN